MTDEPTDPPTPVYDWSTVGKRVAWLLDTRFAGNRSAMAKAIGFTHTAVSRVASGANPPGRRLLMGIIDKLGADPDWLLRGEGEPFAADHGNEDTPIWLPVSTKLLPERLPKQLRELTDSTVVIPGLRSSSQYWYRLNHREPILADPHRGFVAGDLLLLETDPARFVPEDQLRGTLGAVKSRWGKKPLAWLGLLYFYEGREQEGPSRLEADTMELTPVEPEQVQEFVVRRYPDGRVDAFERKGRLLKRRGGDIVELDDDPMFDQLRQIKYTDIVAIWTGILFRKGYGQGRHS